MRLTRDANERRYRDAVRENNHSYSGNSTVHRRDRGKYGGDDRQLSSAPQNPSEHRGAFDNRQRRSLDKRDRHYSEDGELPLKRHASRQGDNRAEHTRSESGASETTGSSVSGAPTFVRTDGANTPFSEGGDLELEDEETRTQRLLAESKARRAAILSKYRTDNVSGTSRGAASSAKSPTNASAVLPQPPASVTLESTTFVSDKEKPIDAQKKDLSDDELCMFADDSDDIFATTPTKVQMTNPQHTTTAQQVGGGLELRDSEGYLRVRAGDLIGDRYQVHGDMGRGVFANVLICTDLEAKSDAGQDSRTTIGAATESITAEDKQSIEEAASGTLRLSGRTTSVSGPTTTSDNTGTTSGLHAGLPVGTASKVAVKVLRANDTMRRAGIKEMEILRRIASADPTGRFHCVRLLDSFTHEEHLCLVFEAMAVNLKELQMKYGKGVGISLTAVRTYGTHILLSLALLQSLGIIHADIKPHNVLVSANLSCAKLADFGSAFLVDDPEANPTPYLVSRFYRAPEIILGYNHTPALDMWSVATLLFELYTGSLLFPGNDNNDMLYRVQRLRGRFPPKMVRRHIQHCETTGLEPHFDPETLTFLRHTVDPVTNEPIVREVQFSGAQESLMDRLRQAGGPSEQRRELDNFCDLLQKMLTLDPSKRITVSAALKHPFFTQVTGRSNAT